MNISKFFSVFFCCLVTVWGVHAQSYLGLHADNYNGLHGTLLNPANTLSNVLRAEINLIGGDVIISNDFYPIELKNVFSAGSIDFEQELRKNLKGGNTFFANVDALGPGVMLRLHENHAIAVYSRLRAFANVNDIDGRLYQVIVDDFDSQTSDFQLTEDYFNKSLHMWGELAVSYAGTVLRIDNHYLKAGATLKYLQGLGNVYMEGNNITMSYNNTAMTVDTQGALVYASSHDFSDDAVEVQSGANGIGADLGIVYEWRKSKGDGYKLKMGAAITDFGKIKYKAHRNDLYVATGVNIDENIFDNNDLNVALEQVYSKTAVPGDLEVKLPMALRLSTDINMFSKFYVNAHGNVSLVSLKGKNANAIKNEYVLTPRFESKWLGVQLPISYHELEQFNCGLGLRLGPVYFGSGSVLTNVMKKNSYKLDMYAGVKIPLYAKK